MLKLSGFSTSIQTLLRKLFQAHITRNDTVCFSVRDFYYIVISFELLQNSELNMLSCFFVIFCVFWVYFNIGFLIFRVPPRIACKCKFDSRRSFCFGLTGECCFSYPIFLTLPCCGSNHWSYYRFSDFLNTWDLSHHSSSQRLFLSHGPTFHFWSLRWKCFESDWILRWKQTDWSRSGQGGGAPFPSEDQLLKNSSWLGTNFNYPPWFPWACRYQYWPQYLVFRNNIL